MAKNPETDQTKEQKCRYHIAKILSALQFHDPNPQTTAKLMRKKLLEIQQKEAAAAANVIKNPPTTPKITIKVHGSTSKQSVHKRPLSQTLHDHGNLEVEIASRNGSPSHSKTLIHKQQKNNNIGDDNGSEAELVIEKRLTPSDVNKNHGRLLMSALKVKNEGFLTADEKMKLGNREDVSVWVSDPEKRWWVLNLAKWRMANEYYALKTGWNDVVNANGLKEGMVIRVVAFRVHQKLCFALDLV